MGAGKGVMKGSVVLRGKLGGSVLVVVLGVRKVTVDMKTTWQFSGCGKV